jgi:hypothetical protein
VTELFPNKGAAVGSWSQGQKLEVAVGGSNARVLHMTKKKNTATTPDDSSTHHHQQIAAEEVVAVGLVTPAIYQQMPISPDFNPPSDNTGGDFSTTFTIPAAIPAQLEARAKAYPIPWTPRDQIATWLDPNRLLGKTTHLCCAILCSK